jgi:hypothetical protein
MRNVLNHSSSKQNDIESKWQSAKIDVFLVDGEHTILLEQQTGFLKV